MNWAAPYAAVVLSVLAVALAPLVRRLVQADRARWLHEPWPALLAAAAGVGAGLVAGDWFELVAFAALGLGCSLLVLVDVSVKRLPDMLVGPSLAALLLGLLLAAARADDWERLGRALVAAIVVFVLFLLLAIVRPSDLGLGDVKLAAPLGLFLGWFGWSAVASGTLLSFAVAGVVAAVLLATGRAKRGSDIPFGPCMVAGTVLGVAFAPVLFPALS